MYILSLCMWVSVGVCEGIQNTHLQGSSHHVLVHHIQTTSQYVILSWDLIQKNCLDCMYVHASRCIHTHTHTHIYICMYMCVCVCILWIFLHVLMHYECNNILMEYECTYPCMWQLLAWISAQFDTNMHAHTHTHTHICIYIMVFDGYLSFSIIRRGLIHDPTKR